MNNENNNWMDLYFKYLSESKPGEEDFLLKQKKMKSFYKMIILPLYKPVQNSKKFEFSQPDETLTLKIMYEDLKKYYGLSGASEVLDKIAELEPVFASKLEPLKERIAEIKESKTR